MAGHSHWAGIKHKKGKADKQRSKIFSKLSKEITVAAKLGDKDTAMAVSLSPSFAATVISFDNLENIFDRCLSAFPFLCLIPAQCECPAIILVRIF